MATANNEPTATVTSSSVRVNASRRFIGARSLIVTEVTAQELANEQRTHVAIDHQEIRAVVVRMAPANHAGIGSNILIRTSTSSDGFGLVISGGTSGTVITGCAVMELIRTGLGVECIAAGLVFATVENHGHFTRAEALAQLIWEDCSRTTKIA
jgi:hypothetical protein